MLLGLLPLLGFCSKAAHLPPPRAAQFHCKLCTQASHPSPVGGKKSPVMCTCSPALQGWVLLYLKELAVQTLHIPTRHPVPWISGMNPSPCNSQQETPISHLPTPSHYSRIPSVFTAFPQLMASWKTQLLKAISPSLCTKTVNPLETSCHCPCSSLTIA